MNTSELKPLTIEDLDRLQQLDTKPLGKFIYDLLRKHRCAPGISQGMVAVAYTCFLIRTASEEANSPQLETKCLGDVRAFIRETIQDHDICMFVINALAFSWEPICSAVLSRYTKDDLAAYVLFGNTSDVRQERYGNMAATQPGLIDLALKILDIKNGDVVADIGCGTGNFVLRAAAQNPTAHCVGYDRSDYYCAIAKMRAQLIENTPEIERLEMRRMQDINAKGLHFDKVFADITGADEVAWTNAHGLQEAKATHATDMKSWNAAFGLYESLESNGRAIMFMSPKELNARDSDLSSAKTQLLTYAGVEMVIAFSDGVTSCRNIPMNMVVLRKAGERDKSVKLINATGIYTTEGHDRVLTADNIAAIMELVANDSPLGKTVDYETLQAHRCSLNYRDYESDDMPDTDGIRLIDVCSINRGLLPRYYEAQNDRDTPAHSDEESEFSEYQYKLVAPLDINHSIIGRNLRKAKLITEQHRPDGTIELIEPTDTWFLQNGDLLLVRLGKQTDQGPEFKVVVVENADRQLMIAPDSIFIIRVKEHRIDPYYLHWYLTSIEGKKQLAKIAMGGRVPNISRRELENIRIPNKPKGVQRDIAERRRELLREVDYLEKRLEEVNLRLQEAGV